MWSAWWLGGAECTDVLLVDPNGRRVPLEAANLASIGEGAELFGVVKAASQTLGRDTFNTRIDSVEDELQEARRELQETKEDLTKKLEAAQQGSLPSRPALVVQSMAKCLVVVGGAAVEQHVNGSWPILSMCYKTDKLQQWGGWGGYSPYSGGWGGNGGWGGSLWGGGQFGDGPCGAVRMVATPTLR
ncbi:hypothetical protein OEZ85_000007 [Tetradesmus obliquus]|uniref:Uncharacterized protein n=1 Tax=Tetradesmus obliquus TaxID=3088 RepID=A0ABY8UPN8_TETOB|nr:hypothetical protein OEZ85_000007 [Tetradesmus obliquus]